MGQIKRTVLSALEKMPRYVRDRIIRKIVKFPIRIPSSMHFKVADTVEELEQAFRILHDAYVDGDLMTPHPSGLRVTKYHSLPSTSTLVAIEDGEVVGTVSLMRKSDFGLPMQSIFEISGLPPGARIAEVSSLAIRKDKLAQRGRILFPLLKFLYHYSVEHFGVTHFVIAVNPKWISFYESILLFKRLTPKPVENYSFVNGAPAVGGILELAEVYRTYPKIYGQRIPTENLSHFFNVLESTNMEFPLRKRGLITDPVMSPDMLTYFFHTKTDCFAKMSEYEITVLRELYNHPQYLEILPSSRVHQIRRMRKNKRFDSSLNARIQVPNRASIPLQIQSISKTGLGGVINATSVRPGEHTILVNTEESEPCELYGKFIWVDELGHFGFQIIAASPRWTNLMSDLDGRLLRVEESQYKIKRARVKKLM